jgi:DNA-3-methyladenine glycosylase II
MPFKGARYKNLRIFHTKKRIKFFQYFCPVNHTDIIEHLQQQDPALRRVFSETLSPPDLRPRNNMYYNLLEAIVSQQLSVKAADTIFRRFLDLFPENYPHPHLLLSVVDAELRTAGLSFQKAGYLKNVAAFAKENDLENHPWHTLTDEEIIRFLTGIKGVGKWTVQMLLMFTLGRPDVLPTDDLGIQQAMIKLYGINEPNVRLLTARMHQLAAPWQPHRTLVCRYLWHWKDSPSVKNG